MSFEVISTVGFRRDAKRLLKKYPSLKVELAELEGILAEAPKSGTPLGNGCFKMRKRLKSVFRLREHAKARKTRSLRRRY